MAEVAFVDITGQVGIDFRHDINLSNDYALPDIMGSGLAVFDYDGDKDLDIYFVGANPHGGRLYARTSTGQYKNVTRRSGLSNPGHGMGIAVGDIENDGDLDVLFTNVEGVQLARNNGDGTFTNITKDAGIEVNDWSTSSTFCDIDGDGFLDLYVGTYVKADTHQVCRTENSQRDFCPPNIYPSTPDRLYRNQQDGTFQDVSRQSNIGEFPGPALGVVCLDFNQDTHADFYVANDGVANRLWLNAGDGTFDEMGMQWGVATNLFGESEAGMGIASGDVNKDGKMDLFVTHVDRETNTLYLSGPTQAMQDATIRSGLGPPSMPFTGFGAAWFDLEHDGDLDLAIANGRVRRSAHIAKLSEDFTLTYGESNLLFEASAPNRYTNRCLDPAFASFCISHFVSRGLVVADLDNDGDLDVVISNAGARPEVLENTAIKQGHWLIVTALQYGRDAIGALIQVRTGLRWRVQPLQPGSSYLSSSPTVAHFGLGDVDHIDELRVVWPDGSRETFPNPHIDQYLELQRGNGRTLD